ncbi:MAG: YkgJ family cysteine cluster protein [Planctomycetaceae bacterium]|nr:YkgJ family cysteine cluster protein [Planctomycetaceae bacterium]
MSRRPRREEIQENVNLCEYCSAKCCRYFALPIDTPKEPRDYDHMRWFLLHEHATVFVEEGEWFLLVHTDCNFLRKDNLCGIYEVRPNICRKYTTAKCEYEDHWVYEKYFETSEQVSEYAEVVLGSQGRQKSLRTAKPLTP